MIFQFSSVIQSCPTLCNPMDCSTLGFPVHYHLLKLAEIHVHWVGDAMQPSHLLSSPSLPAFNLSQHQGLFQWVILRIRWPKYWVSASASVLPVNIQDWFLLGLTGLISFDLQETLKSLLQHHSSKASILRCSAFFMVQLSHPYMTIGKTIALTWWTSVGKVMSLLFNMLSRLFIAFLPRSKHLSVAVAAVLFSLYFILANSYFLRLDNSYEDDLLKIIGASTLHLI